MAPSAVRPGSTYLVGRPKWWDLRRDAPLPKEGQRVMIYQPADLPRAQMEYCFARDAETHESVGLVPLWWFDDDGATSAPRYRTTYMGTNGTGEWRYEKET